jgi:hypothetical protein
VLWNGAVWKTLSDRALPPRSALASVAVFPGGGWAVGEYGLTDHGDGGGVARHLILRVTGTSVQRVPVPGPAYARCWMWPPHRRITRGRSAQFSRGPADLALERYGVDARNRPPR